MGDRTCGELVEAFYPLIVDDILQNHQVNRDTLRPWLEDLKKIADNCGILPSRKEGRAANIWDLGSDVKLVLQETDGFNEAMMPYAVAELLNANVVSMENVLENFIKNAKNRNDMGYVQSAWDGVNSYANDNKMSARYYQPVLDENGELTSDNVEKYVKLAQDNGAKYIVFPGEKFEVIAYEIASSFPELNFVLVDGIPHSESDKTDRYISNVMCVTFDNLQSGYLAGYIAVKNGNTKLGYFGQYNSDDSANYGAGFAQGAAAAANELGVPVTLDASTLLSCFSATCRSCFSCPMFFPM